jgi:hypothetical protein
MNLLVLVMTLAFILPSLASAITTAPSDEFLPFLSTLCDGDCGDLAVLDTRRIDAGFPDDFSLGLRLIGNGLDLTLKTDGNILIVEPVIAAGNVNLITDGTIVIGPGSGGDLGGGTDIVFDGGDVTLGAGCSTGAIATMISRSEEELAPFRRAAIVAAVTGLEAHFPRPKVISGFAIYREGDIYIDVSNFEFQDFTLIAGKSIVFVNSDSTPVPEPGTGLLLGFGLTMLAASRPSTRTTA